MSDQPNTNDPMAENPPLMLKKVKFKKVHHDGEDVYEVEPKTLELEWPIGGTTEVEFLYDGKGGVLFIPIPGIFEQEGGRDQIFRLGKGKKNTIRLKPKSTITLEGDDAVNGLVFPYAIYDEDMKSFAVGNSPPKMKVGP